MTQLSRSWSSSIPLLSSNHGFHLLFLLRAVVCWIFDFVEAEGLVNGCRTYVVRTICHIEVAKAGDSVLVHSFKLTNWNRSAFEQKIHLVHVDSSTCTPCKDVSLVCIILCWYHHQLNYLFLRESERGISLLCGL